LLRLGKLQFEASLGKKVSEAPIATSKLVMVVLIYDLSYAGGIGRRIVVSGCSRQKHQTLSEKITKAKRDGGMTQVIEHLPSTCKALSSNPRRKKKKKKKETEKERKKERRKKSFLKRAHLLRAWSTDFTL
jgi:hypothetical protein